MRCALLLATCAATALGGCTSARDAALDDVDGGAGAVTDTSDGQGATGASDPDAAGSARRRSDGGRVSVQDAGGADAAPGRAAVERTWTPAPPTFADPPLAEDVEGSAVRDAVALDVDLDGDTDLVVATREGLRVLDNRGAAGLRLREALDPAGGARVPEVPGTVADVRALATDGQVLIACTAAGRELVLAASPLGLVAADPLPWRRGVCVDVALTDTGAVATLIAQDGSVALHMAGADGVLHPPPLQASVGIDAHSQDPAAAVSALWSLDQPAQGAGAARLVYELASLGPTAVFTLPLALPQRPDEIALMLRSDGAPVTIYVRLVDATGAVWDGPLIEDGPSWETITLGQLAAWGLVESEPTALQIVVAPAVDAALSGWLEIDLVTARVAGHVPWVIDDFERSAPRHAWADAAQLVVGDVDGDGGQDLVVRRAAEAGVLLAGPAPGAFVGGASLPLAAPGGALVLLDADGDDDLDLLRVGDEQDRLWVGDGWGHFVDATLGALPVDWSDGTSVASGDLDRDGWPDVVIGNDGASDRLYLGRGDGRFEDATPALGFDALPTVAVLAVDLNGDDVLDVVSVGRDGRVAPLVRLHTGAKR